MSPTYLQIFLLINVFLMGVLVAIAVRHAYAHFRPDHHDIEKPRSTKQDVRLPPTVRKRLLETSEANFQTVLERSAAQLQRDLEVTEVQLNKRLEKLGTAVVGDEMDRYRAELDQLRKHAETTIVGAQAEIAEHQTELKAKLAEEMVAEKQRLVQQMDMKLADAVASFLIETLPHNVDLGAQSAYLMAMLEEHKAELTKGVTDEA
jgi:hypothetical protein